MIAGVVLVLVVQLASGGLHADAFPMPNMPTCIKAQKAWLSQGASDVDADAPTPRLARSASCLFVHAQGKDV